MTSWLKSLTAFLSGLVAAAGSGAISEIEAGEGHPWGTLSGLTAHPTNPHILYAVPDQDSPPPRVIEINVSEDVPRTGKQILVNAPGFDALDIEGVTAKPDGGFWLASEGNVGNTPPNVLLEIDASGQLQRSIGLPASIAARMDKKGFEGVALDTTPGGSHLYVAFQAPVSGDPPDFTRIGAVDLNTGDWTFYAYPLDRTEAGDFGGLSELVHLGNRKFAALERDGNTGHRSLKHVTVFDLGTLVGAPPDSPPTPITKKVAADLVPMFKAEGRKVEKEVEGLTVAADGEVYALTDNDNLRPTVLIRLGKASELFDR